MEGSETDQNKNNENNKYNTCMDIEKKSEVNKNDESGVNENNESEVNEN